MKSAEKRQGVTPQYEQDIRKVVEDKNIDVITIATPNHWHSLAAIWGLQNGKNVYVEKPVSHNVSEGRRIVETARKQKPLCQAGTQSRSSAGMSEAMAVPPRRQARQDHAWPAACATSRAAASARSTDRSNRPKTVDYDLWCGPAPHEAADAQAVPLRLALVLGLRQRRPRQPGHP